MNKLNNGIGLSAQGNPNPPSRFSNLYVVDYLGTIYDPSYGVSSSSSISKWESKVIDGYGIRIEDVRLRNNNMVPPSVTVHTLDYIHRKENTTQQTTVN